MFKIKLKNDATGILPAAKRFAFLLIDIVVLRPLTVLALVLLYPSYSAAKRVLKRIDNGYEHKMIEVTNEEIEEMRKFVGKYHELYGKVF